MDSDPSRVIRFDVPRGRPLGVTPVYKIVGFFLKPLLNLIVIPAAVIGATLLWCEELRPRR